MRLFILVVLMGLVLGVSGCDGGNNDVLCGNGVVDEMEVCDDGELSGETCESQGFAPGGTLACSTTCDAFDTSGCDAPLCNNGAIDTGEACDGTDLAGEDCVTQGFDSGTLACSSTCDDFDVSGCFALLCNNGAIDAGEDCDGADLSGQDCVTQGFDIGTLACYTTSCTFDTTGCANTVCGDEFTEGSEECDGADLTGLGCVDLGFDGGDLACTAGCDFDLSGCTGGCGNGVIEGAEVCDATAFRSTCPNFGFDAGELACSADCGTVDTSGCFASTCGDTMAEGGEECDGSDLRGEVCLSLGGFDGGMLVCDGCALNSSGCTLPDPAGENCGSAGVIDPAALPLTLSGNTISARDDYGASTGDCPGMAAEGAGNRDVVYSFTPSVSGSYTFTYTPDFDGAMYVVTDCSDIAGTCLGGSEARSRGFDEIVTIDASAGTTYFIVLDGGFTGHRGTFTLQVSAACLARDCTGRACGDDGCGGSCGTCAVERACDDASGACVDPAIQPGNGCTVPYVVPGVPYTDSNDNRFFANSYGVDAGECPGVGTNVGNGSSDVVYEFTPTTTGTYTIDVTPAGFDIAVFVTTTCGDLTGSCLLGTNRWGPGATETILASLSAGTTYNIHVDGAFNFSNQAGTYVLDISDVCVPECTGRRCGSDGCGGSCGECAAPNVCNVASAMCEDASLVPGNTCALAIPIGAAPFTAVGDTSGSSDDFAFAAGVCPGSPNAEGGGSGDLVYAFTPPSDGPYTFRLTPGPWDAGIFLVSDCADTASTCIVGQEVNTSPLSISATLVGGTTYYIIADGGAAGQEGEFELDICRPECAGRVCGDDGCGGSCGSCPAGDSCGPVGLMCSATAGETCTAPFVIGALPYTDSNDTRRFTDEYGVLGGSCPGVGPNRGGGSSDVVYAFTPSAAGDYVFEVTSAGFNAGLFVTTTCGDFPGSCLGGVLSGGSLALSLAAGTTYYVHLDGIANTWNAAGPYTLSVREPVCGDGILEALEECDDSNTSTGDGCDASCLLETFDCSTGTLVPVTSTDVPVAIPVVGTYTSTLTVPTASTVLRARVNVDDITHTWDSDLDIVLISPSGTRIGLSAYNGGSGENYIGTVFDDGCGTVDGLITGGTAPFTGCYRPEDLLLDLVGEASNGTWTLEVSDSAGGDVGDLNAWSLDLCVL